MLVKLEEDFYINPELVISISANPPPYPHIKIHMYNREDYLMICSQKSNTLMGECQTPKIKRYADIINNALANPLTNLVVEE